LFGIRSIVISNDIVFIFLKYIAGLSNCFASGKMLLLFYWLVKK